MLYFAYLDEFGHIGPCWIVRDPALVKQAGSIRELAVRIGVPPDVLTSTVARYNTMLDTGRDTQFGRFGKGSAAGVSIAANLPPKIATPPFYAMQFFPLTRKSMGGIVVDEHSRVLDKAGRPIAGLYAAGEAAGLAGINGKAALEGTFLGPSVLMGRIAARSAASELELPPASIQQSTPATPPDAAPLTSNHDCLECHDLQALASAHRPGYWHFERAHTLALERKLQCHDCHSEIRPKFDASTHRINRLLQSQICSTCHASE